MQITRIIRVTVTALVGIFGLFGTQFVSRFIREWTNEVNNQEENDDAAKGREVTGLSDQILNDQTNNLPKD